MIFAGTHRVHIRTVNTPNWPTTANARIPGKRGLQRFSLSTQNPRTVHVEQHGGRLLPRIRRVGGHAPTRRIRIEYTSGTSLHRALVIAARPISSSLGIRVGVHTPGVCRRECPGNRETVATDMPDLGTARPAREPGCRPGPDGRLVAGLEGRQPTTQIFLRLGETGTTEEVLHQLNSGAPTDGAWPIADIR